MPSDPPSISVPAASRGVPLRIDGFHWDFAQPGTPTWFGPRRPHPLRKSRHLVMLWWLLLLLAVQSVPKRRTISSGARKTSPPAQACHQELWDCLRLRNRPVSFLSGPAHAPACSEWGHACEMLGLGKALLRASNRRQNPAFLPSSTCPGATLARTSDLSSTEPRIRHGMAPASIPVLGLSPKDPSPSVAGLPAQGRALLRHGFHRTPSPPGPTVTCESQICSLDCSRLQAELGPRGVVTGGAQPHAYPGEKKELSAPPPRSPFLKV